VISLQVLQSAAAISRPQAEMEHARSLAELGQTTVDHPVIRDLSRKILRRQRSRDSSRAASSGKSNSSAFSSARKKDNPRIQSELSFTNPVRFDGEMGIVHD